MKLIRFFFAIIFIVNFLACKSIQMENTPPFKIISATYMNYIGAEKNSNAVIITISYKSKKEVNFKSIYFLKNRSKLKLYEVSGNKRLISVTNSFEYQQKKSKPLVKKKFALKKNEAVISYIEKDIIKYYKIKVLKNRQILKYK